MTIRTSLLVLTAFIGIAASLQDAHAGPIVGDASFENPALPNTGFGNGNNFLYDPTGTPWTYGGNAGVSANGGPFYSGSAPDGVQAAFLQSNASSGTSSISATITGLVVGNAYSIVFYEASRPGYGTTPLQVSVNSVSLGFYTNTSSVFAMQTSTAFTAMSTTATLSFVATNTVGNDNDVNLDQVSIASVPEPGTLALLAGLPMLAIAARRRHKA